ncbi:hypothetical protein C0J50_1955 [Silurus asotus]|uniref:Uncharacterized protein n=1 Tax=Silurus asotus TaxID=30991 RepID=A0AAD4ZYK4_SILAS|nr:hypothetical protein C0J50_1955 [Silurus asotus]
MSLKVEKNSKHLEIEKMEDIEEQQAELKETESEAKEAQRRDEIWALKLEISEIAKDFQDEKANLVGQLNEHLNNMEKEKNEFEDKQKKSQKDELQLKDKINSLKKMKIAMPKAFNIKKENLESQFAQMTTHNRSKEYKKIAEKREKRQRVLDKHTQFRDALAKIDTKCEKKLAEITGEVEILKETVKEFQAKAQAIDSKKKDDGSQWFKRVFKWKKQSNRQWLEEYVKTLESNLSKKKVKEAHYTKVIDYLAKERITQQRQFEAGVIISIHKSQAIDKNYFSELAILEDDLIKIKNENAQETDNIHQLIKKRAKLKKQLPEAKEKLYLQVKEETMKWKVINRKTKLLNKAKKMIKKNTEAAKPQLNFFWFQKLWCKNSEMRQQVTEESKLQSIESN